MAEIVNTPGNRGGGAGGWIAALIAIVAVILIILLFFPNLFANTRDNADEGVENIQDESAGSFIPPTINNTIINSTSTINVGTTTGTTTDD